MASSISYTSSTRTTSLINFNSTQLALENIMPGIYLTRNFFAWSVEKLHSHGFTHVITIDKHMQKLQYTSPHPSLSNPNESIHHTYDMEEAHQLCFDEFETIDLNFGEKAYLTTVLPNCYKSVKFIDQSLSIGGTILIIDFNGGEQKCLTITTAYLMYKNNLNLSDAFNRLKAFYKKADLDRFYISQLYEYEPILQVQRAQSRGHSCSRELHSAILKRKKLHDDNHDLLHSNSFAHFSNNVDDITME
ncbi:uncharacterized protein LOC129912525 isoform X2 [Episyrphus balteatus]|nr:uncharacterized protein LOC129912525 isoform X2 [Episyrphus balteatus]XP_055846790.1 uncharacterized protein LOC129912525 isoform X2 [Episyrphus balteatus]